MSKKEMINLIETLGCKYPKQKVYSDFLELSTMAISNSCDIENRKRREEKYKNITKEYRTEEIKIFQEILGELTHALEEKHSDILGEIFMEIELGGKWNGQFYTPYHICIMAATLGIKDIGKEIEQKGFIEINEPSCGAGAMIIATAELLKNKGYNPQQCMKVICKDLDLVSVYMTFIQLSLLGIPAKVLHANTLNSEIYDTFMTPSWALNRWKY